MATAILLSVFLRAQHFPAAPLFSRSCQNNRVTEKTSSLSSAQKHFPVGGTMGRAGNKGAPRSDERRVSPRCVFGSGIFFFLFFHRRGAEAWRRVDALRWRWFPVSAGRTRCGGRELCLSVFGVDGKDTRRGALCGDGADSFPGRRDGSVKTLAARIHTSQPEDLRGVSTLLRRKS